MCHVVSLQAQFVIGMCHAGQSLYFGCRFIRWMQYALIFYGMTILALFINFYYQAYVKAAKRKKVRGLWPRGTVQTV